MINIKGFQTQAIKDLVSSFNDPNTKQYFDYDADGDVIAIYKAQSSARNNEACLKQVFEYALYGPNKLIAKISWTDSEWDSTWDIA